MVHIMCLDSMCYMCSSTTRNATRLMIEMAAHLSLVLSQTSNCSPDSICTSVTTVGSESMWATGVVLAKSYKVTEFLQRKSTNKKPTHFITLEKKKAHACTIVMFLPTLLPEKLPKGHQLMLLHTNGKDAARIKYKTISFCSFIQSALFHCLLP